MLWIRKMVSFLVLALAVSMFFLPFPDSLAGERPTQLVVLVIDGSPLDAGDVEARFGAKPLALRYESLEATPEFLDAVLGMMGTSGGRCVPAGEWSAVVGTPTGDVVYTFRDGVYRISNAESVSEQVCFDVEHVATYDNPEWSNLPRLGPEALQRHPDVLDRIEALQRGPLPVRADTDITGRAWRRFLEHELPDAYLSADFVFEDLLVRGFVEDRAEPWTVGLPWLPMALRILGGILALAGLCILISTHRATASRPGIPVAAPWFGLFTDVVGIIWATVFVALMVDTFWVAPMGQSSLLGLHPEWPSEQPITGMHFVSIPAMLLAFPIMTLFFTSLSAQRIHVDDTGITSFGALGRTALGWDQLTAARFSEQRNPASFTVVDFRKLQTVLELEGDDESIVINQPSSRSRKDRILSALLEHAPDTKRQLIEDLGPAW
jgi:hypothetical protein